MALALNGPAVLACIAAHPEVFANVREYVTKAVVALVVAQIKAKATDLERLRAMRRVLGDDSLALILEGLKDADIKRFVGKFDKHDAAMKTASAEQRRRHLLALADGVAEPAQKPAPVKKMKTLRIPKTSISKQPSGPKEPERLASEAMRARRKRR